MTIVTRFAPSPTGYLHIGNVRTALFNFLLARHYGGQFLLRIEDTDRKRHNEDAVRVIYDGLKWLGLSWDDKPVSQFERRDRHAEVAHEMMARGNAYKCYLSPEELDELREKAKAENTQFISPWRNKDASEAPADAPFVVRLRADIEGETTISDLVQGDVTVPNSQIDDLVLLRSDGTPTYMLSVVVDDHDMNITHVVRGDDHLTNTFRQAQIYNAMGWDLPRFAHLPMILGDDGGKLSKRHGALGLHEYIEMGYLPEALCNYLMRLGWSHGDDEIISMKDAVSWFDFDGINKSAGRFDFKKLNNLNAHYIKQADDKRLLDLIVPSLKELLKIDINETRQDFVLRGMNALKDRAETLVELTQQAALYAQPRPVDVNEKAAKALDEKGLSTLASLMDLFQQMDDFTPENIEQEIKDFVSENELSFKDVGMPLRAALTGTLSAPALHDIVYALGREETIGRLQDAVMKQNKVIAA